MALKDVDQDLDGVLVRSDNFHGIALLTERYSQSVDAIYIDPPYNTDASAILYKNDYKDSSWLALLESRCKLAQDLLADAGVLCVAIDDVEFAHLKLLLVQLYGSEEVLGTVAVRSNPAGRSTPTGFSIAHDYAIFVGASPSRSLLVVSSDPRNNSPGTMNTMSSALLSGSTFANMAAQKRVALQGGECSIRSSLKGEAFEFRKLNGFRPKENGCCRRNLAQTRS